MKRTAWLIVMSTLPLLAAAEQTIWRCGSSYSAAPCAEGRTLEPVAARPGSDLQAAQAVAGREKRLAEKMRADRLLAEAAAQRQGAAGIRAPAAVTSTAEAAGPGKTKKKPKAHPARHPAEAGTWQAIAPATRRTKG